MVTTLVISITASSIVGALLGVWFIRHLIKIDLRRNSLRNDDDK